MDLSSPDVAVSSPVPEVGLRGFMHWMAEMIQHAFGDPREESLTQPPAVGVQPYRDRPLQRR